MRIVLVTGDRHWKDEGMVFRHMVRRVKDYDDNFYVVHGDATGADAAARTACHSLRIPQLIAPARWGKYHRAAGPIRNQWMLRTILLSAPGAMVEVSAYHDSLEKSSGTAGMVELCRKAGISVVHYYHGEDGTEEYKVLSGYVPKV